MARHRPVVIVGRPLVAEEYDAAPTPEERPTQHLAPYAAVAIDLTAAVRDGRVRAQLAGPDGTRLSACLADGVVTLEVTTPGARTEHRSRRHGRVSTAPDRLAVALTGTHVTAFTHEAGRWLARARYDVRERLDPRDTDWLDALRSGWGWDGSGAAPVRGWRAGDFGQLGLRDLRIVTWADGSPYRQDGRVLLTATSAGPGFFDTAHTSLWSLDERTLTLRHHSDLYFERPNRPGGFGDHATHLVRDADQWLVATSTWGDFRPPGQRGRAIEPAGTKPYVDITLATSNADLTRGRHRLPTQPFPLPTDGLDSVGVWDPHLVRGAAGWQVGFVSARRYFDFHPALATGPVLDRLTLRAAATDRSATEGITLLPTAAGITPLASDGADNARRLRRRYPVFDRELRETGTLRAPYLTNIPWPTLVAPAPDATPGRREWLLVTFDGTSYGGPLLGYGTHGDVIVMRADS